MRTASNAIETRELLILGLPFYAGFHTKDKAHSYLVGDGVDITELKYAQQLDNFSLAFHAINNHTSKHKIH